MWLMQIDILQKLSDDKNRGKKLVWADRVCNKALSMGRNLEYYGTLETLLWKQIGDYHQAETPTSTWENTSTTNTQTTPRYIN